MGHPITSSSDTISNMILSGVINDQSVAICGEKSWNTAGSKIRNIRAIISTLTIIIPAKPSTAPRKPKSALKTARTISTNLSPKFEADCLNFSLST